MPKATVSKSASAHASPEMRDLKVQYAKLRLKKVLKEGVKAHEIKNVRKAIAKGHVQAQKAI